MTRPDAIMNEKLKRTARIRKDSGQTLVIAIIILGVLAILGFAFATIISRNISQSTGARERSVATDLARAGAEFAHYQMRFSALGADWRPEPVDPATYMDAQGYTKDPDAHFIRPGDPNFSFPGNNLPDFGGPDGYGPYSRVFFERGRALVRVRFAPSELDAFAVPTGQLRQPGKARSYLIVETVGRPGGLLTGGRIDPSRQLAERVRVSQFATPQEKQAELGRLASLNNIITDSRKLLAFASIGIIESGRYITNKHSVSRAAELGFPNAGTNQQSLAFDQVGVGATYGDGLAPFGGTADVRPVVGRTDWGRTFAEPNAGRSGGWATVPGLGSLWCNGDLRMYGTHTVSLNQYLGESWSVAGKLLAADNNASMSLSREFYDAGTDTWRSSWPPTAGNSTVNNPLLLVKNPGANQLPLDSDKQGFQTIGSAVRDGKSETDELGYPRATARKEPPSILEVDPQNGQNRYLILSRNSGKIINGRNVGRFGFGRGVYVDSPERGNTNSEDERIISGAVKSLPNDWLNPNNATSQGWRGPYYIPLAAHVRFVPDGFEIVRDSRSRQPLWRTVNGGQARTALCRFRLVTVQNVTYIVNSIQHPTLVNQPMSQGLANQIAAVGERFNGVLYFEGDVRVRGIVPTDHQVSVVSMGSIYVEGSVTKGVMRDWAPETGQAIVPPQPLTRPSRSLLMLMARDYVTVNTTMFFGPAPGTVVNEKVENVVPDTPNPFELSQVEPEIVLEHQFLLDPQTPQGLGGNPNDPSTWLPFANHYTATGTGVALAANLLLSASADDNGPSFVSMDVRSDTHYVGGDWGTMLFPRSLTFGANTVTFNAASQYFGGALPIPVYGLGNPLINSYPKFEGVPMPLVDQNTGFAGRRLVAPANLGNFSMGVEDSSFFRLRLNTLGQAPTKNFLAAKTVVAPADVRIEAAMFAEEGSFFVIPGHWFNMNPDDTRQAWLDRTPGSRYAGLNDDDANRVRFESYGHGPEVPFFGEPIDVKISIFGSVSENMPAPIGQQAEWLRKWGWIPRQLGSTGQRIPTSHSRGVDLTTTPTAPNLTITYDPVLATGTSDGVQPNRTDLNGWSLAPLPRLPVSPTLAYFGEVNP